MTIEVLIDNANGNISTNNISVNNLGKNISVNNLGKKERMVCNQCKCRINITNSISCECGKTLCMQHRYFNTHECTINYKEKDRKIIEKNNPQIIADKIIKI